jgi:hypothetical protein
LRIYRIFRVGLGSKTKSAIKTQLSCSRKRIIKTISKHVPILDWLPKYSIKDCLLGDVVAGVTVAVLHIPQGWFSSCNLATNVHRLQEDTISNLKVWHMLYLLECPQWLGYTWLSSQF